MFDWDWQTDDLPNSLSDAFAVNTTKWLDKRTEATRHIGEEEDKRWPLLDALAQSGVRMPGARQDAVDSTPGLQH